MKVLFVVQGCRQGGANRSLQYLLPELKDSRFQFSICALSHQGPYNEIFSNYTLLKEDFLSSTLLSDISKEKASVRKLLRWIVRTIFRVLRIAGINTLQLFLSKLRRTIEKQQFDVVIAFQEGTATEFVSRLNVRRRIAWIHSDYVSYLQLAAKTPEKEVYRLYHSIVCVSEFTSNSFGQCIPELKSRVKVINNVLDQHTIREQANQPPVHPQFKKNGVTLISVGRLDPVKRFSKIPAIAAELKKQKLPFRWFVIGSGEEQALIRKNRQLTNTEDSVVLLGELSNPYPYIASSDVLVSISLSEACPLGVQEAKILHVPVLSSDYGSASEFVKEGQGGKVVAFENITAVLTDWLSDPAKIRDIKKELDEYSIDNRALLDTVYSLLE